MKQPRIIYAAITSFTFLTNLSAASVEPPTSTVTIFSQNCDPGQLETLLLSMLAIILTILLISVTLYRNLSSAKEIIIETEKKVDELIRTDHLTGMNNRKAFFEKSRQAFTEAKRIAESLTFILIDIDQFKQVNQNHGHSVGDELIKGVAETIEDVKREMDISARFGSDEFIVLCPFTEITGAVTLAERIRVRVEKTINKCKHEDIRLTISLGVYGIKEHSEICEIEEYVKNTEEALQKAKEEGRNRVSIFGGTA